MDPELTIDKPYLVLKRGGYIVETSVGYIQFGAPPETIKDTMKMERSVPLIFVLPNKLFHVEKGISIAELEFPLYFNHFIRQKKTYIVCTREQKKQLMVVLQESVFGPERIDLRNEYIDGEKTFGYPDMKAEIEHFRGDRRIQDLVHFVIYNHENQVQINQVYIEKFENSFLVRDLGWQKSVEIPGDVEYKAIYDLGQTLPQPYEPPLMGITCLGPSHGFDPEQNTSGFLIWINHKGIMVDPPVNSTEWLRGSNVNPRLINSIILTHCHADHDAGTFQKILEEDRVTIYSTETVMHSFIHKYHGLTQIPMKELYELFDFVPVVIGKSYIVNGAEFRFNYALHSIPSLSFEFSFQDKSFVYSSDHLNEPEQFQKLYTKGVLTESRFRDLNDFPWHHDIIYHEAGIPPLHTRVDYLQTLPPEVQDKITVYHIARKDMPPGSRLTLATFGIENTLVPEISPPEHEEVIRLLDALANVDIFRDFPIAKSREFLSILEIEHYKRGELIIKKDSPGDKFFIIQSGNVRVEGMEQDDHEDETEFKRYGQYEYFGEASLIMDQPRSADVVAETDVVALTIEKNKFLNFIKGSSLNNQFELLNTIRKTGTWDVLTRSRFFKGITSPQKTQLELIMHQDSFEQGDLLIRQNHIFERSYIIKRGQVEVLQGQKVVETLERGDFCGEIYQLQKELPATLSFRAKTELEAYTLQKKDLVQYIVNNPGVYMRLNYVYGA
ncbi:MAG: cAMP/cGMP-dependent 3',5'-cyclic-AMP/GMP phosphodiesterase [Leptospiraceae bacterium]|nr:cAMP/cGMP-dependent 3',5'-cyclic-AMP/GMP phosphodiesterase [Leptospiraceae bacterium]